MQDLRYPAGTSHPTPPQDPRQEDGALGFIRQRAAELFENARSSHDWEHTQRVCRLCWRIGPVEGAHMPSVIMAAYLHDIGRCAQDRSRGAVCHARVGAEMARPLLAGLPLPAAQRENIIHCIQAHRFRGPLRPRTIEARVLFDADKLDAIGAVGVARAYLFAGEVGARLHNAAGCLADTRPYSPEDTGYREYRLKLCRIKDCILTLEGRKIAGQRHAFMEAFFERFIAEYEGRK